MTDSNCESTTVTSKSSNFVINENEFISLDFALEVLELGDFEEKWAISKVLVKYGEAVIPFLKKIILDENADVESRWYGLKILSQIRHPEIILILTELLTTTQEEDLIVIATQTLASQGKNSITFLCQLLNNPDYRLLATKALAQIPSLDVIEPLLSLVNDEDSIIRTTAIVSLGNFDTPEIKTVMINALKDYSSSVRKEALIALGLKLKSTQDKELINLIIPLLEDLNLSVATQAAIALSRCENSLAIEALNKVLHLPHTPEPLKVIIVKALAWIATPKSIQYLGKSLYNLNVSVTLEIIDILGRITKPRLKSQVVAILTSFYYTQSPKLGHPEILQALCYSLKQLRSIESVPILEDITENQNPQVRFYAQSALQYLRELSS
ncbi:HEAT repeat domain-containing protein [Geminocystis sp. NIES-3709]|uniref:HEAT repeat domain-containing protein n=1 Tax=Geminocystis sp. NIES-3709 TaxID=1617448 RepID=UPI0005FC901E|nr:HEAT repeat domain-containing protein [Geminocystis sp. NIES-3709]BAQ66367.1 PBS lyase heat-like repeat [Geminocystis sp. NIES-3709]